MAKRRKKQYCIDKKHRLFNEAWALLECKKMEEKYGHTFRPYKCRCGWWHTYDRTKRRKKYDAKESRSARRRRSKMKRLINELAEAKNTPR